jgi:hypothetical protein
MGGRMPDVRMLERRRRGSNAGGCDYCSEPRRKRGEHVHGTAAVVAARQRTTGSSVLTAALRSPLVPTAVRLVPICSYGTNAKTKNLLPNGFYKFRVHNVADLELLLMHNRRYSAEIAAATSARTRKAIVERAAQLGVRLTNGKARLTQEESA